MQGASDIPEPDYPYPVRYWWLKWICMLAMSLLLLLTITRLIWGWDAQRRLRAELDAARARGEPVVPEEFRAKELPDSENYVIALQQVLSARKPNIDSPSASDMEFENYLPLPPEWHAMTKTAISGQAAVFAAIKTTRSLDQSNWQIIPSRSSGLGALSSLGAARGLANLFADAAVYLHLQGDDIASLDATFDMLRLGRSIRSLPTLVGFLVGVGIDSLTVSRLQIISPGLLSRPDDQVRQRVERLIELLSDAELTPQVTRALWAERAYGIDLTDSMASNAVLLRPMYDLESRRYAQIVRNTILSLSDPALRVQMPQTEGSYLGGAVTTGQYSRYLSYSGTGLYRIAIVHDRALFERRAAAVSLAVRLYQLDHQNQWPGTLADLVPRYLPRLPADPLSPTREPLKYVILNNGTRPMIYSRGENGEDQRSVASIPPTPQYGWHNVFKNIDDQYRDLSRFTPPPTTPATAPADAEQVQAP